MKSCGHERQPAYGSELPCATCYGRPNYTVAIHRDHPPVVGEFMIGNTRAVMLELAIDPVRMRIAEPRRWEPVS